MLKMVRVCVDCQKNLGEKAPFEDVRVTGTFCLPCKQDRIESCETEVSSTGSGGVSLFCVALPLVLFVILI